MECQYAAFDVPINHRETLREQTDAPVVLVITTQKVGITS